MFESFSESLGYFGTFSAIGFVFGLLYYIGTFFKITLGIKPLISNILDCLFVLLCGMIVFLISIGIGTGAIRFYYLFALTLGFCIYSVTLGKVTILISGALRKLFLRIFRKLHSVLSKITKPILLKIKAFFVDILQKLSKITEKYKIHLKNDSSMVYNVSINKMGKIVGKGGGNRNVIKAKVSKNS